MTIQNVCIVDIETTSIEPEQGEIIELGIILYSVERQTALQQFSTLLPVKENLTEFITRIPFKASTDMSLIYPFDGARDLAKKMLFDLADVSDFFIAHNKEFERKWLDKFFDLTGKWFSDRWLCTYEDFIWPLNSQPTSLINTCLNHGIAVKSAHRALTDCQLIAELFDRADDLQFLFEKAIARSKEPTYRVIARISYDDREQAKEAGFHWDGNNKQWFKVLRLSDFKAQKDNWAFSYGFTSCKDD